MFFIPRSLRYLSVLCFLVPVAPLHAAPAPPAQTSPAAPSPAAEEGRVEEGDTDPGRAEAGVLTGRVTTSTGQPLEAARVEVVEAGLATFTDRRGTFRLEGVEAPALVLVTHPRFQDFAAEVTSLPGEALAVRLLPKQEVFEEIVVTSNRAGDSFSPVSMDATVIVPTEEAPTASTLTDALVEIPGVAENGQGGLFQVFSVRGIGRNRVTPLVDGMRIITERRAGVALSFIDPTLMGEVNVIRGPVSTYWGSGALGGVVQIFPRELEGAFAEAGYQSQSDESYQTFGWGDGAWSVGLARRSAGDGEAADGSFLFNGYDQYSASVSRRWSAGDNQYRFLVMPSAARDIHKPNTDYPRRVTVYPEENHLLAKFEMTHADRWRLSVYAHPNELLTEATRVGQRRNDVDNSSFDYGASWQAESPLSSKVEASYGVEYFGRRDVTAVETEIPFGGGPTTTLRTLDGAREDELAGFGALHFRLGPVNLETGGRFTWQRQENVGFDAADDTAWTGFVGLSVPVAGNLELAANVGTGLRFPSLSERFFSGTTGRGGVIGNPGLDPERSLSTDAGLSYFGDRLFLSTFVFRNEIDDYIERVEVSDDLLTYVNLTGGTIEGWELEGFYQVSDAWRLSWGGAILDGEADDGSSLADVPPATARLGVRFVEGPWRADARYARRFEKDDPGPGELAIPGADLVTASVGYQLRPEWQLRVSGENLLDELYFPTADDKASFAPGRSLGLAVVWNRRPAP